MNKIKINGMTAGEKQLFSLLVTVAIALLLARIVSWLFWNTPIEFLLTCMPSLAYFLIAGAYNNGELEHSVQSFLKRPTDWVLMNGLSWGIPRPFGRSVLARSIAPQTTTLTGDNEIAEVTAKDGSQVSVGVVIQWRVVDVRLAGQFSPEDLGRRVSDIEDRGVRWFALYRVADGDGPHVLTHSKSEFSQYLVGKDIQIQLYDDEGNETGTVPAEANDGNSMQSKFKLLGVEAITAEVKDVNAPLEVREARNKEAAEAGQAATEKLDIASFRARVLEAQYGTSDEAEIKKLKADTNYEPAMSRDDAVREVRASRNNLTDINVSGNAGDFTKGAALGGGKK